MTGFDKSRKFFFWAFFLYAAFILYGSLVPLNLRSVSLSEALTLFSELRFLNLDKIPRMDWATNIVLGIPVGFFGLCWITASKNPIMVFMYAVVILLFCLTLSITAEFLQIFFSSRVPTINDIVAQFIGAVIGVLIGIACGGTLKRSFSEFMETRFFDKKVHFLFSAYLLGLILLNVMPLDLSLSPVDIYRKWHQGYINFVPFAFKTDSVSTLIYNTVVDTVKWIPVPFFIMYLRGGHLFRAILGSVFIAFAIEFAQVFVMSRITDATDMVTALAGSALGGAIACKLKNYRIEPKRSEYNTILKYRGPAVMLSLWMFIPLVIDWYPFTFVFDKATIKFQLAGLSWIPFSNYQANNFYHAIAASARKIIVFIPAGMITAYLTRGGRQYSKTVNGIIICISSLFIIGWAGVIEIGQFFLPDDVPDLTDIMMEFFGFLIGYWILQHIYSHGD